MKIETLLANLALNSDFKDPYGASHFPIYNTATFDLKKQEGNERIYDYSRSDNPTRNALENIFAKAENGLVVFVPIQELQQFRYFLKQFSKTETLFW